MRSVITTTSTTWLRPTEAEIIEAYIKLYGKSKPTLVESDGSSSDSSGEESAAEEEEEEGEDGEGDDADAE